MFGPNVFEEAIPFILLLASVEWVMYFPPRIDCHLDRVCLEVIDRYENGLGVAGFRPNTHMLSCM